MSTDDLNERCDNPYCVICGPPKVADFWEDTEPYDRDYGYLLGADE